MWAALTCGVYGLFRTGELTTASRSEPHLQRSACSVEGAGHYRLHLDASKTDIFRQGADVHIMANGSASCPASALAALLALRPSTIPTDPLYRLSNGRALTRDLLIAFMHRLLTSAGINPVGYSGHSMRRGGAQALFDAGISERDIWNADDDDWKYFENGFGFRDKKLQSINKRFKCSACFEHIATKQKQHL
jgi:hypothetical protein